MKRSPLKRSRKPLRRGRPLQRVSKKKTRQLRAEAKTKRKLVELTHGLCEARIEGVCMYRGVDKHETKTRGRGGDPTDLQNVILACRPCHDWIDEHPREALALGLLRSQFDKSETSSERGER